LCRWWWSFCLYASGWPHEPDETPPPAVAPLSAAPPMHIRLAASSPTAAPIPPPRRAAGLRCARIRNARIRVQSADSGGPPHRRGSNPAESRAPVGADWRFGGFRAWVSVAGWAPWCWTRSEAGWRRREIFGESRGGWVSHAVTGGHVSAIQN